MGHHGGVLFGGRSFLARVRIHGDGSGSGCPAIGVVAVEDEVKGFIPPRTQPDRSGRFPQCFHHEVRGYFYDLGIKIDIRTCRGENLQGPWRRKPDTGVLQNGLGGMVQLFQFIIRQHLDLHFRANLNGFNTRSHYAYPIKNYSAETVLEIVIYFVSLRLRLSFTLRV